MIKAISGAMNKGLDFNQYGENVIMAGQNSLIILLILMFSKRKGKYIANMVHAGLVGAWAYWLLGTQVGETGAKISSSLTVLMLILSKVPQLYTFWRDLSTGALSLVTVFLEIVLSVVTLGRLFALTNDSCYRWATGISLAMNLYILYYTATQRS